MQNSKRTFVRIIQEICKEEQLQLKSFSYDWVFSITDPKSKKSNYIIGYQFGLNSASINSICCDKSAASEIMTSLNIPNVEHYFFMSPNNQKHISNKGNWSQMVELLQKHKKIVCKDNQGTGGNLVYLVQNQSELESAAHTIFQKSHSMAISPYYEINNEYRVIVLDRQIKLVYSKVRQSTTDESGKETLANWKHNLGQGAQVVIEENSAIINKTTTIAKEVIKKLDIRFASIDIIQCGNEYKVLEINSGVMMEHFASQSPMFYETAKKIYREAILSSLK